MEIYVMAPDGSAQTRLTNNPAEDSHPAVSPDGHRIAFQRDVAGTNDFHIYVMNADGSGEIRLTSNSADDSRPAFSPDGRRLSSEATATAIRRSTRWRPTARASCA